MENVDLDINSYSYDELLVLFKLKEVSNRDYLSSQLEKKMAQIKEKYPENIQHFYYKGKIIILAISQ